MQNGYAPVTAAGLYGADAGQAAAYGIVIPAGTDAGAGPAIVASDEPGSGTWIAVPREFWRSSGFGLVLLLLLVIYFDVRLLNR